MAMTVVLAAGCGVRKQIKMAPQARLDENKVRVFPHVILIESSEELIWGKLRDSRSMVPVMDKEHHTIEFKNPKPESLKVGDIISFWKYNMRIIHRIVEIAEDKEGWYAITRGDNAENVDAGKIRPGQIIGVVVAIFY
jgi:hypothetical protein